jgi:chemotaxis protein CheD
VRHVVGVGDMKVVSGDGNVIVTHGLGSCLGVTIYDPVAKVGGMFHVMLPASSVSPDKAVSNPLMFVDTGLPLFFRQAYAAGASKQRLITKVAGGASLSHDREDFFAIGKRNYIALRKIFWQNGVMISKEDVGGNISRTMYLDTSTGRTWLQSNGTEWDL